MKYIIIGRTGTGKTSLLNMLEQRGLKPLITKTTRPIRGPQDTNYMFLSKADADKIPDDDKFLYTIIDGDEYFTSQQDVRNADVMVLEPSGLWEVLNEFPDTSFHIISIQESNPKLRRQFAIARCNGDPVQQQKFSARVIDENDRFAEFEQHMTNYEENKTVLAPNATRLLRIVNDYAQTTLEKWADWLVAQHRLAHNLDTILQQCVDLNTVDTNDRGEFPVKDYHGNVKYVNREYFLDMLMNDEQAMSILMHGWLSHHIHIGIPDELAVPPTAPAANPVGNTAAEPADKAEQPFGSQS